MKKIIALVILTCFNISISFSQTKKDTEDWLLYYLDKYFSKEYLRYSDMINNTYSHQTYKYSFDKNIFIVKKYGLNKDSSGKNVAYSFIDSINLQKVRKVEVGALEQELSYDSTWNIYGIKLIFNPDSSSRDPYSADNPVKIIDDGTMLPLYIWRLTNDYSLECYNNIVTDGMLEKFRKAFEHLIELDDGKLIKDLF